MAKFVILNPPPPVAPRKKRVNLRELEKAVREFRFRKTSEAISRWSQPALSDRMIFWSLLSWVAMVLISAIYAGLNFSHLPYQIPLFYSRPWGDAQLGKNIYIFLPAAGAFLLGIFNLSLAVNFLAENKVAAYFLSGMTVLVTILSTITVFNIINLMR